MRYAEDCRIKYVLVTHKNGANLTGKQDITIVSLVKPQCNDILEPSIHMFDDRFTYAYVQGIPRFIRVGF